MTLLQTFERLFSPVLIEQLGWTLIHSVWQIALVALVASVIVRCLQRSSAVARHNVLVAGLVLVVAAPLGTWIWLYSTTAPVTSLATEAIDAAPALAVPRDVAIAPTRQANTPESVSPQQIDARAIPPVDGTWLEQIQLMLQPWLMWVVLAWSLGVALGALRPLWGWRTLGRLRNVGISPASDTLLTAFERVSKRLGLRSSVQVFQSTLAQVPIVVGYFRPVILVPLSLATSIPASQLEAILAHELAHIQRHDFLVNLLQILVETLLFYHPAVWWFSRQIRVEREHCCDDLVVSLLGDRVEYGRALVAIEELRGRSSALALGAADGSLLARVRRILRQGNNSNLPRNNRLPIALLGVAACSFVLALSLVGNITAEKAIAMEEDAVAKQPAATEAKPADGSVEKRTLEVLKTPYDPDPGKGSWQSGAHESGVLFGLALNEPQDRVVATLLKVVNRTETASVDQRRLAMTYLGGRAPQQVIPVLLRELQMAVDLPREKFSAHNEIVTLGQIGEDARAAIPVLIKLLDAPDWVTYDVTITALVKIGPSSPVVLAALAKKFDGPRAVYEAGRFGELAKPLGPKFLKLLDSKSKPIRIWAAQALVKSKFDETRGFEELMLDVAKGKTEDRSQAATALAALGSQATPMLARLQAFENDADPQVAKEVRDAIRRIKMDDRIFTHAEEAAKTIAARQAAAEAKKQINVPPLPDLRLTGDEVTPEAISKLAERSWGTVTLADARFTGEIVERLRHAASIRELRLFGTGLSGQIPRLDHVSGLVSLEIGAPLTGHDLEAIGQLPNLERLSLPQELTINVSGAQEIARLVRLKSLRLYNVNIDDAAFVEMRTLIALEELDLTHTRVTDEGLKTIEKMPALRILELHRHPDWYLKQQLSDACLKSIARLPALERLSLSGKITNDGLKQVGRWPKLKTLSIYSTEITGAGFESLENSNIEHLTVGTHQLGDEPSTLEHLKKCRKLKRIHIIGKGIPNVSEWQERLPNLEWSFSS